MTAYVYQAAMLCEACARDVMRDADANPELDALDKEMSDRHPQGPYSDGGGEADTPQHCDHCSAFLRNPLTQDGYAYVRELVAEHDASGRMRGVADIIAAWRAFYSEAWE